MEKKKKNNPFLIIVDHKSAILSPEDNDYDPVIEERAKMV